ncbi:hypothetical protein [Georgenia sp. Marseille-Q6866]
MALLVALAVTVASGHADFLSTLALALAVIAFVVQIIVFIAQTSFSAGQLLRAEEVHGSTMRALAAIEEKTEGTRQTINTMNDHMLAAFVEKSTPPSPTHSKHSVNTDVGRRVADLIAGTPAVEPRTAATARTRTSGTTKKRTASAGLPLPDGERMRNASEALASLSGQEVTDLEWLAEDYLRFGHHPPDARVGHGVSEGTVARGLYEKGLAKKVRATWGSNPIVWVLTDLGRDAGAILVAPIVPNDLPEGARAARKALADEKEALEEILESARETDADIPIEE